jgi:predicted nuclease of predicted toxin-antitoxin system
MARIYADEDFSYPVVTHLRQLGHDILTAQEAGQANQRVEDCLVLAYASEQDRALLTFNRRDFIRLHREVSSHAGIVVCSRDDDVFALAERIHRQVESESSLHNQLFRINRPSR